MCVLFVSDSIDDWFFKLFVWFVLVASCYVLCVFNVLWISVYFYCFYVMISRSFNGILAKFERFTKVPASPSFSHWHCSGKDLLMEAGSHVLVPVDVWILCETRVPDHFAVRSTHSFGSCCSFQFCSRSSFPTIRASGKAILGIRRHVSKNIVFKFSVLAAKRFQIYYDAVRNSFCAPPARRFQVHSTTIPTRCPNAHCPLFLCRTTKFGYTTMFWNRQFVYLQEYRKDRT